ncbi:MAG TPA: hypothetical protein PK364_05310 [Synergistaceae bacterium]|nr:hypothetical protein [Synergistaceae bacterium]HPJ26518.1 hypothetical protein [Synergistaceae bacterium]HPQ37975.1 hypothetical protein [Synergistaceae bacterium]
MRKRRIDWEEEEKKTSKARLRGLRYTFVSLLAVLGVSAVLKVRYPQLDLYPAISVMAALLGGAALLILLTRK